MIAYQIKGNGAWTGATTDVEPTDGLAPGWVRADAPPALADGQCAVFAGDSWVVYDAEPVSVAPVPAEVTMRQAQRALLDAGLLDAVEAAINALPDPPRRAALIDWTKSSTLRRDSQFVAVLAPGLGLDAAALDALFVAALKVPV